MKRINWLMAIALPAVWAASAAADDVETTQKVVWDKYKALKSLRYKSATQTDINVEGYKSSSKGKGTFEMARRDGKILWRMDSKTTSETEMGGKVTKSNTTSLIIVDGQFTWSYNNTDGRKSATKMKLKGNAEPNPFAAYRDHYNMSVLPDEDVAGHACHVFQMLPKQTPQGGAASGKTLLWYRKDCGVMVKMIVNGTDGKPMSTFTYTDLEINTGIGAKRFVFTAPDGVDVVDMDKGMQQPPPAEAKKPQKKKKKKFKLPDFP